MRAEHVKKWLAAARKAEKDGDTAGGEEAATTTAEGKPETTSAQEGAEKWMSLCGPTEGRSKSEGERGKEKRVDIDGNMETH